MEDRGLGKFTRKIFTLHTVQPFIFAGDDAYSYEFEDSALVAAASAGYNTDTGTASDALSQCPKQGLSDPHMFRECCWNLSMRGSVGETGLHVCFLVPSALHMELAKRMIAKFPKVSSSL